MLPSAGGRHNVFRTKLQLFYDTKSRPSKITRKDTMIIYITLTSDLILYNEIDNKVYIKLLTSHSNTISPYNITTRVSGKLGKKILGKNYMLQLLFSKVSYQVQRSK